MKTTISTPVKRFLDAYLSVECRIDYYTLGQNPSRILENVTQDDSWTKNDTCRLLRLSNLACHSSGKHYAGLLTDNLVIAGHGYLAGTPIVFGKILPGYPFAVINRADFIGDWRTFADLFDED
jgi:hypothetical protein